MAVGILAVLAAAAAWLILRSGTPDAFRDRAGREARLFERHPDASRLVDGVHLVAAGPEDASTGVVFLHGSPGDWRAQLLYLEDTALVGRYRLLVPDRPGYGLTGPAGRAFSMAEQAARIAQAVRSEAPGLRHRIWVGHSFGASVAARAAMDHPREVDGLVLVSGAMAAAYERQRWWHSVGRWGPVRRRLPADWETANGEAIDFEGEFELMEPLWGGVACPVTLIHGTRDRLADFRHVAFTVERLPTAPEVIAVEGGHHFLYWTRPELVTGAIESLARRLEGEPPG